MFDPFVFVDGLEWKGNIFRDDAYLRKVFTVFSLCMVPVWFLLGFDSGVGLLEKFVINFPSLLSGSMSFSEWVVDAYTLYGRTFHFSAFVTYGLLYVGLSSHLANLNIRKSRNVVYSIILVGLNVSCFELLWMGCFAKFQMSRDLLEWLVSDSWFLVQWFGILGMGLIGVFGVFVESFRFELGVLVERTFRFRLRLKDLVWIVFTVVLWLLWIYYPFHVEQTIYDGWVSSKLFPQTHYAYKDGLIYVENNLLHALNVVVKGVFAYTQLSLIRRFRR